MNNQGYYFKKQISLSHDPVKLCPTEFLSCKTTSAITWVAENVNVGKINRFKGRQLSSRQCKQQKGLDFW